MAKLIGKFDDHHDYVWKCDCGDWHYLEVTWDDKDTDWRYLEITDTWHPQSILDKLKVIWKVVRNEPHYHHGIVLDEKNVADVLAVLAKHSEYQFQNWMFVHAEVAQKR